MKGVSERARRLGDEVAAMSVLWWMVEDGSDVEIFSLISFDSP